MDENENENGEDSEDKENEEKKDCQKFSIKILNINRYFKQEQLQLLSLRYIKRIFGKKSEGSRLTLRTECKKKFFNSATDPKLRLMMNNNFTFNMLNPIKIKSMISIMPVGYQKLMEAKIFCNHKKGNLSIICHSNNIILAKISKQHKFFNEKFKLQSNIGLQSRKSVIGANLTLQGIYRTSFIGNKPFEKIQSIWRTKLDLSTKQWIKCWWSISTMAATINRHKLYMKHELCIGAEKTFLSRLGFQDNSVKFIANAEIFLKERNINYQIKVLVCPYDNVRIGIHVNNLKQQLVCEISKVNKKYLPFNKILATVNQKNIGFKVINQAKTQLGQLHYEINCKNNFHQSKAANFEYGLNIFLNS